jgi:4-hydroxythreonine-4-phosphate dehydrogenase
MSSTASPVESTPPIIALTAGEPAGIGPDLLLAAAARVIPARLAAFTDPVLLKSRAERLGIAIELQVVEQPRQAPLHRAGHLCVVPISSTGGTVPGKPDPRNASFVLSCIRSATAACLAGHCDAMVTGPVQKATINDAGIPFRGHTEFLAELCGAGPPVMLLASPELRVALVTTHLPLSEVSRRLTPELLEHTLRTVDRELRERFDVAAPLLLVCGLNPHAGESGWLGREDRDLIEPVVARLRAQGLALRGPVPADTAFTRESLRGVAAVIAMYHDQGLPPLKALGFGRIANITLGLPILRTSVDHGTALELAGSGRASADSLLFAIDTALALSARPRRTAV